MTAQQIDITVDVLFVWFDLLLVQLIESTLGDEGERQTTGEGVRRALSGTRTSGPVRGRVLQPAGRGDARGDGRNGP